MRELLKCLRALDALKNGAVLAINCGLGALALVAWRYPALLLATIALAMGLLLIAFFWFSARGPRHERE